MREAGSRLRRRFTAGFEGGATPAPDAPDEAAEEEEEEEGEGVPPALEAEEAEEAEGRATVGGAADAVEEAAVEEGTDESGRLGLFAAVWDAILSRLTHSLTASCRLWGRAKSRSAKEQPTHNKCDSDFFAFFGFSFAEARKKSTKQTEERAREKER